MKCKAWILCIVLSVFLILTFVISGIAADFEVTKVWSEEIDGIEYRMEESTNRFTGKQRFTVESDISLVINETDGLEYTITKTDKDAKGNLIPESTQVYSGTYHEPGEIVH